MVLIGIHIINAGDDDNDNEYDVRNSSDDFHLMQTIDPHRILPITINLVYNYCYKNDYY